MEDFPWRHQGFRDKNNNLIVMSYNAGFRFSALVAAVALFLLIQQNTALCQELVTPSNQNEKIFLARTKQFNEFLDRFNYKTDFRSEPADSAFRAKIPRENMVNSLFDLKDKRLDKSSEKYSQAYSDLKKTFVSDVVNKNVQIPRYSGNIIAEARSRVTFKGSARNISIFLAQETVRESRIKWVILGVSGDLFNFLKTDTAFIRFIPPSSNETDFMNLKRALEDVNYLQYYASKDYLPDNLTLFFYLLNTGALKYEYAEEVTYHILDIPGWCIRVKEFNRNELNSGWLITDLSQNSLDRLTYIRSLE